MQLNSLLSSPDPKEIPTNPSPNQAKWFVIESKVLNGEHIVVLTDKKYLKEAREEEKGKVVYCPFEINELTRLKPSPQLANSLKFIHAVKKEMNGLIVSKNSPLYQDMIKFRNRPTPKKQEAL